jgi:hypothetical protein
VSKLRLLTSLIPGGLPKTVAKLLLSDDAKAVAHGVLHATSEAAEVRDFHAEADGLTIDGRFALAPKLHGKLTAKYAVVSVDIPLGTP